MKHLIMILVLLTTVSACGKKEEKSKKPEKTEATAKKEEKPLPVKKVRIRGLSPDSPRSRGDEIATPEDFEEEASRTVALENLEAELDRLEAEIVASPN
jgi:hypothetical protein